MARQHEMDMVRGPLLKNMFLFSLPIIAMNLLQLLFNAADMVIVGQFSGSDALAAVGATAALISLLVNLFMGLSVGTSVIVAQDFGSGQQEEIGKSVHTSIALSLICGFVVGIGGFVFCEPLLVVMGTPENILDAAVVYMKIYFVGTPANMIYNFGAAVLRATGDSKRPMYYLVISGALNVVLNVFFIVVLGMNVDGVAWATVISQYVSAVLLMLCLMRSSGFLRFAWKKLAMDGKKLKELIRIGLPAGTQGAVFSLSNVLIQSSINSFGSIAMAGSTAAGNLESFVYVSMNACHQTAVSFVSQNLGAGKMDRIKKVFFQCLGLATAIGLVMGVGVYLLGEPLLRIYTSDSVAIEYGIRRLALVSAPYFLCGIMDTLVGCMRGLGYSVMPMVVSMLGACGLRIVWILTVFRMDHAWDVLFLSYPVTWIVTASIHAVCLTVIYRHQKRLMKQV